LKAAYFWRAAYACVITALLFALFANWAYDDPFITFRYAENLALGNGFVFNVSASGGERVLSTTTPLFTLLLAAARFVTPDLQRAANLISALSTAVGALCLFELARSGRTPQTSDTSNVALPRCAAVAQHLWLRGGDVCNAVSGHASVLHKKPLHAVRVMCGIGHAGPQRWRAGRRRHRHAPVAEHLEG
jgi:hypothetical protein